MPSNFMKKPYGMQAPADYELLSFFRRCYDETLQGDEI